MKTLIFSIYISTHGVYQWEVRMFLNSLLTWSLGRAAHKCCVAGVEIGDRGILGAVTSWLQHHAQLVRACPGSLHPYSRLICCLLFGHHQHSQHCSKMNSFYSFLHAIYLFLALSHGTHPTPEGKLRTHSLLSQSFHWRRAELLLTTHLKLLSKELV